MQWSKGPQPHLKDGSAYRQNRPTELGPNPSIISRPSSSNKESTTRGRVTVEGTNGALLPINGGSGQSAGAPSAPFGRYQGSAYCWNKENVGRVKPVEPAPPRRLFWKEKGELVNNNAEIAVLGGGCFWCVEAVFTEIKGVSAVISGYSGGHAVNPTYYQVCGEKSGHAEVVQVEFDPTQISFTEILEVFFASHDPTTPNRQGADVGTRYRSVIFYLSESQKDQAAEFIKVLDASGTERGPVVTELAPFGAFYPAEQEHQLFYRNNPGSMYCRIVINPKVAKVRQKFAGKLR